MKDPIQVELRKLNPLVRKRIDNYLYQLGVCNAHLRFYIKDRERAEELSRVVRRKYRKVKRKAAKAYLARAQHRPHAKNGVTARDITAVLYEQALHDSTRDWRCWVAARRTLRRKIY